MEVVRGGITGLTDGIVGAAFDTGLTGIVGAAFDTGGLTGIEGVAFDTTGLLEVVEVFNNTGLFATLGLVVEEETGLTTGVADRKSVV